MNLELNYLKSTHRLSLWLPSDKAYEMYKLLNFLNVLDEDMSKNMVDDWWSDWSKWISDNLQWKKSCK